MTTYRGPGLSEPEVGLMASLLTLRGSFGVGTKPGLGHGVAGPTWHFGPHHSCKVVDGADPGAALRAGRVGHDARQ